MTAFNSQSHLQLKRARKKKIRLILYCSLGAAGAAGFLYFLFFSGYFSIRAVSVSGVDSALAEEIKKIAWAELEGSVLFVSRRNVLLFSTSEISEKIKNEMPILEAVTVKKRFIHNIAIEAKLREKKGIACAEAGRTQCFYFDKNGVIFEESPEIVGAAILLFRDNTVLGSVLPSEKYTKETMDFADNIKAKLFEKTGISVSYFVFLNNNGDIEAQTDKGFKIMMTVDDLAEEQARVIKSVLDNEIKDKINSLDYIDLRVENRAYYKLRE